MGSFVPKTDWKYDDTVTEHDLNRIEQGIKNAHDELNSINEDFNSLIGELPNLETETKESLVAAINELQQEHAAHSADDVSHITSAERTKWNGADSKAQDLEILYWMGAI